MKGFLAVCLLLQHLDASFSAGLGKSDENSGITYVQIKPLVQRNIQQNNNSPDFPRSSRIENVPLQIRPTGVHPHSTSKPLEINIPVLEAVRSNIPVQEVVRTNVPVAEVLRTPRSDEWETKDVKEVAEDYVDQNNESEARFDTSEAVTPSITDVEDYRPEIKISTPQQDNDLFKLSGYYQKSEQTSQQNSLIKYPKSNKLSKKYYGLNFDSVAPTYRKYLETRQLRSRCRCERIWNCPKLQITVPRCPVDYFMCCF